jgi:TonB-dependent starch-binding outer membrane protein SusC
MGKHFITKLLLLLAISFGSLTLFAQVGNVTGTVTDETDGTTLPGASVLVKGTTQGTVTDVDGVYTISVTPNATLVFSFVGYESQEILVQPNTKVNVALKLESTVLSELVVIGYGVQKKGDATGSVTAIDTKEFNRGAITTPTELISGKIAGVQVTNEGGAPGSSATIRIRGGSSLQASNDPLYVIDGVPVDFESITGMRNPLSMINPQDIESFTVLKDASATAIYGSRASNGVIIITTKKGTKGVKGKPITLNYTGNFSFYTPTKTVDVYGAEEYRKLVAEKYPTHTDLLGDANTDWQNEILNNAFGMDHYLSAFGAYKWLPYRVSVGYSNNDGILKTDNYQQTTIGANISPVLLDDHLKIDINAKGTFAKNRFADRGAIGAAVQFDPTQAIYNDNVYELKFNEPIYNTYHSEYTNYSGYNAWLQSTNFPVDQATTNPVALLDLRDDRSKVNRFIGNAQIDYKFHFLPELRANLNVGYDHSNSEGDIYVPSSAAWEFEIRQFTDTIINEADTSYNYRYEDYGGLKNHYTQEKKNELLDFYLNYVKEVAGIQSKFDVMAGYSWQHFWTKNTNHSTNIKETRINDISDYETENYLVSFFGRLNYAFKDRYLLTFTLRNDGTSRFSEDNRWGLFPSVAVAWKIVDESFMNNAKVLSELKLRLGWGVTGQQNIGQGDYPYLARYTYGVSGAMYQFGNQFFNTLRPEGYDANIKWEETTTWNIGLDYGFAKDRFYGSLDFYDRKTADLINEIPVPAGTNLTNYILTNIGDMENKGVEFSIMTKPVIKQNYFWELGFNATYNKNEITKLTATDDPDYLGYLTGNIAGGVGSTVQVHSVGYPKYAFFVYEQVYDADGMPVQGMYVDRNGDGQITDADRYRYHKPDPDVFIGISSRFNYKNWDFYFAGRANFGNYVYNNVASENGVYERLYRPEGPYLSNITTSVKDVEFQNPQYLSDYYISDASFFRMDNISLSYSFKNLFKEKVTLQLSGTVNNAFVITNYKGLDPEIANGIDNNIYPRPRVYVLGVNLQF